MKIEETKLGFIGIIERMPTNNEQELADIVKDLVNDGLLPRSSPPAITNHPVTSAMLILNQWLRKTKSS